MNSIINIQESAISSMQFNLYVYIHASFLINISCLCHTRLMSSCLVCLLKGEEAASTEVSILMERTLNNIIEKKYDVYEASCNKHAYELYTHPMRDCINFFATCMYSECN